MDWQPIETVPEDEWVLGYFPVGEYSNILTVRRVTRRQRSDGSIYVYWYGDHHSVPNGNQKLNDPTHWMPLPDPPPDASL